jgi:hypothetical protein
VSKARFSAELIQGHGGVTAVIVPFDPELVWETKPTKIDPRRDGWLVRGTMNRVPFFGWIGYRWGRFFIIVDPALRDAAKAAVGDTIDVVVEPTTSARALATAREQAKLTTAAKRKPARTARR